MSGIVHNARFAIFGALVLFSTAAFSTIVLVPGIASTVWGTLGVVVVGGVCILDWAAYRSRT